MADKAGREEMDKDREREDVENTERVKGVKLI